MPHQLLLFQKLLVTFSYLVLTNMYFYIPYIIQIGKQSYFQTNSQINSFNLHHPKYPTSRGKFSIRYVMGFLKVLHYIIWIEVILLHMKSHYYCNVISLILTYLKGQSRNTLEYLYTEEVCVGSNILVRGTCVCFDATSLWCRQTFPA